MHTAASKRKHQNKEENEKVVAATRKPQKQVRVPHPSLLFKRAV